MSGVRGDPLFILAVLLLLVVCSEWLARRGALRYVGSALLVILLGAIVANLGIIPAGSPAARDSPRIARNAIGTFAGFVAASLT